MSLIKRFFWRKFLVKISWYPDGEAFVPIVLSSTKNLHLHNPRMPYSCENFHLWQLQIEVSPLEHCNWWIVRPLKRQVTCAQKQIIGIGIRCYCCHLVNLLDQQKYVSVQQCSKRITNIARVPWFSTNLYNSTCIWSETSTPEQNIWHVYSIHINYQKLMHSQLPKIHCQII